MRATEGGHHLESILKSRLNKWKAAFLTALFALVGIIALVGGFAQPVLASETEDFAEVHVGTSPVFAVTGMSSITAGERAEIVNRRIEKILNDKELDPKSIRVSILRDGTPGVVLGDLSIVSVSLEDAQAYSLDQMTLARDWSNILRAKTVQLKPLYEKSAKTNIKVLTEQHVLLLILQVAILLGAALLLGELATRIRQPAVIGQLMAGLVLGPSVLGSVFPEVSAIVFPVERTQSYLLEVVSWLGIIFLLMLTGMETDLSLIKKQIKASSWITALGSIIPFAVGVGLGYLTPTTLLVSPDHRLIFALLLGTVMCISSVPVIAKILMDMRLMQTNVGQIIVSSALLQDILGCLVLGIVAAIAGSEPYQSQLALFKAPIGTLLFVLAAYFGRRIFYRVLGLMGGIMRTDHAMLSMIAVLLLFGAATTQFIGVHVVLGAFTVGVLIAQAPTISNKIVEPLHAVTMAVFAPIFFAAAGLHVNLTLLLNSQLLALTAVLVAAACISKIGSCYVGGRMGHLGHWESLSVGLGANARGAMGLVIAILGFSLGILTVDMFSMIVLMSLLTTAMAPSLLTWSLRHLAGQEERKQSEAPAGTAPTAEGLVTDVAFAD